MQLLWFKRDLRLHDHAPLAAAAAAGRVLPVYVHEPELLTTTDHDPRHAAFVEECLQELRVALAERGAPLLEPHGVLPDVFEALCEQLPITAIYAHEECGNGTSYARDRRVRAWARRRGLAMHEFQGSGVVRRLASRDGWHEQWLQHVRAPRAATPLRITGATADELSRVPQQFVAPRNASTPPMHVPGMVERQTGGRTHAERLLGSFLQERGEHYRVAMSSPSEAIDACSRLSPHLTWGTLSVREAYQAARGRAAQLRDELKGLGRTASNLSQRETLARWQQSLVSFASRIEWRDHFIQKLESEPALEYRSYAPIFDNVWSLEPDAERLDAWREGRTGYPLVDACMRSVHATGWLTFRMRAMVMSFASHYLWLHWRPAGLVLARAFTDYEPGIHWMQCQMQAGVTGINTIRIYNPIKQAAEHDAAGDFVRRWVPELSALPTADLLRPWDAPPLMQQMHGMHIGRDYPRPIVPHEASYTHARDTLHTLKQAAQQQGVSRRVWQQHGSRKTPFNASTR
ncbi:hypothetical protein GEMMAAP_07395 [Gemmatimonas phototrophica]|uniref:Photolyase/cryptochrome alpha/beta domain-containing protein n=1 Tax=Gemmatimonas phototrophica TaxID=1379270 RepID=A0A143BNI7_9BACT|nr:hypothetical protein GEMMAAP_07395 [Gemmatimonas phototrophica]